MRRLARTAPLAFAAALVSCVSTPESYPVPPQHKAYAPPHDIVSVGGYVTAAQPDAELYFVRGVKALEAGSYRWTFPLSEYKFYLSSVQNLRLRIDIGINDVAFRQTGPARLEIYVNGQRLDSPVYDSPGDRRFEMPVPPSMLKENTENRVGIQVLNPWQSPDPNIRLGVLIFGLGFVAP